jgi:opacity protein-like surface antigen
MAAALVTLPANGRTVLDETKLYDVPLEATGARGAAEVPDLPLPTPVAPLAPTPAGRPRFALVNSYGLLVRAGPAINMRPGSPTGIQAEVAAGAWLAGIVGIEAASGVGRISGVTEGWMPYASGWMRADVEDEMTIVPALLTVKLGIPIAPLRPYLLGGAGLYSVRVDRRPAHAYPWVVPGTENLSDDVTFLAFHAGAGAEIRVSSRAFAALEVRYSWDEVDVLHERVTIDTVAVSAGVGYRF